MTETLRPGGNFDTIGPDRYLAIISAILILFGAILVVRPPKDGGAADWSDLRKWPLPDYLIVALILMAYIWAIGAIGFSISSIIFFIALYRLLGQWSWPRTMTYAFATATFIYLVFVYFSDLPMPKSFLGI